MKTIKRRKCLFLMAMFMCLCHSAATAQGEQQQKRSLQDLFDGKFDEVQSRASGDVIVVDLSKWQSDYSTTLTVKGGKRYKFINGTIKKTANIVLLEIIEDSEVDLAETATLSNGTQSTSTEVVNVKNGTLIVSGGDITPSATNAIVVRDNSTLTMSAGKIDGLIYNYSPNVNLNGGSVTGVSTENLFRLSGDVNIKRIVLRDITKFYLTSSIKQSESIKVETTSQRASVDEPIVSGSFSTGAKGIMRLRYQMSYQITSEDLKKIDAGYYKGDNPAIVPTWCKWSTYLKDNSIYLKQDKNAINCYEGLVERIDEIAKDYSSSASKPVTLTIADNGINLNGIVKIPPYCHIILTGGKMTVKNIDGADFLFIIDRYGSLNLQNITLDCNNYQKLIPYFSAWGDVTIGQNVTFSNISQKSSYYSQNDGFFRMGGESNLNLYSGNIKTFYPAIKGYDKYNGNINVYSGCTLECTGDAFAIDAPTGNVNIQGGTVVGNAHGAILANKFQITSGTIKTNYSSSLVVADSYTNYKGGKLYGPNGGETYTGKGTDCSIISGTQFDLNIIYVENNVLISGSSKVPTLHLNDKDARIYVDSKIANQWKLDAYWKSLSLDTPIVCGSKNGSYGNNYLLTKADFEKMVFLNLPDDYEAYYDDSDHSVKLKQKLGSLQDLFDTLGDDKGTEENPRVNKITPHTIICVGMPNGDDVHTGPDLHTLFEGDGEDSRIDFNQNLYVDKGSSVEFKELTLNGYDGTKVIYVDGTLIININVTIKSFTRFIYVRKGGKVIWKGGNSTVSSEVIYNDGGTVEIHDGTLLGSTGIVNINGGTINIYDGLVYGITNGNETNTTGTIYIHGGTVYEGIVNYATLIVNNGTIDGGSYYYGITNYGTLTVNQGTIIGKYSIYNYSKIVMIINGGDLRYGGIWSANTFQLSGNALVNDVYIQENAYIRIISRLTVLINIHFINTNTIIVNEPFIIGYGGYWLTSADAKNIKIDLSDEYRWFYSANVGGIIIRVRRPYDSISLQYLFDDMANGDYGSKGSASAPEDIVYSDKGIDIDKDVHVLPDLHTLFEGESSAQSIRFRGGNLYVDKGASATFANITLTGNKGNGCIYVDGTLIIDTNVEIKSFTRFIYIRKGGKLIWRNGNTKDVEEVIHNEGGSVEIVGGSFSGSIWSDANIYLSGSVSVTEIFIRKNVCIFFTSKPAYSIKITFVSEGDIAFDVPIIKGANGYVVTGSDLSLIINTLSSGYQWEYDNASKGIVIRNLTGIASTYSADRKAYVKNGVLYIDGAQAHDRVTITSTDGTLYHPQKAGATSYEFALPRRGLYIVKIGRTSYKVVF